MTRVVGRRRYGQLALIAVVGVLLAACGDDGTSAASDPMSAPAHDARTSESPTTTTEDRVAAVSGAFGLQTSDGYTADVTYRIETMDLRVDIESAPPGHAVVELLASGELELTNTTAGRSLDTLGGIYVEPFWKARDHAVLFEGATVSLPGFMSNHGDDLCSFVWQGESYCSLGTLSMDTYASLGPDESTTVSHQVARDRDGNAFGVGMVAEGSVPGLEALMTTPPDLLRVAHDSTSWLGTCRFDSIYEDTLAVLDGGGALMHDPRDPSVRQVPPCEDL